MLSTALVLGITLLVLTLIAISSCIVYCLVYKRWRHNFSTNTDSVHSLHPHSAASVSSSHQNSEKTSLKAKTKKHNSQLLHHQQRNAGAANLAFDANAEELEMEIAGNATSLEVGSLTTSATGASHSDALGHVNTAIAQQQEMKSRGKLAYSLEYDFNKQSLIVTIKYGEDLPAMDLNGTSDPFVKIILNTSNEKKHKHSTKVIPKNLNPVFNQSFAFEVKFPELKLKTLELIVLDFDRFSSHDQIGRISLPLKQFDFGQNLIERFEDIQAPLIDSLQNRKNDKLGEICFSIKYVPNSNKLTIVILEAKALKKMDIRGLSDPYVKIAIFHSKKRIKKKKTTIKKCTLNPYFNESFSFEITPQMMESVDLVLTVMDYDRIGNSDRIGQVVLGPQSHGQQLSHWSDMLANPRQTIAQWHKLSRDKF